MRLTVGLLMAMLFGCVSTPPPGIPMEATPSSRSDLAGRWVGEYRSPATGRHGTIFFDLSGGRSDARGFVLMYSALVPVPDAPLSAESRVSGPATDVLAISFIRAADGRITGDLAPYRDPVTGATLRTRFEGVQNGETIEGTFESYSEGAASPVRGTWKVTRQRRT